MPPDTEDCQLSLPLQVQAPMPDLPAADAVAGRLRRVVLGGELCHFRLRRARRRTIGFQIDDQGLTVSAPKWVSLRAIEEAYFKDVLVVAAWGVGGLLVAARFFSWEPRT